MQKFSLDRMVMISSKVVKRVFSVPSVMKLIQLLCHSFLIDLHQNSYVQELKVDLRTQ